MGSGNLMVAENGPVSERAPFMAMTMLVFVGLEIWMLLKDMLLLLMIDWATLGRITKRAIGTATATMITVMMAQKIQYLRLL
ncbi:hypothetical protein BC939DRAFT_459813 [Gamsiella multidivaricata]|uniref:uncharacterized protein n=1 Tax=Gamsiella multidivaricata TaxID=101098 RepID=UPI0022207910|nr:uncharacterized protein BC939DRAFT_459813 [Gamsiella multidivaricata]KAI7819633.1 hypothetical protein BC939DRAFT_459813 [Gamsiella multidivaricata]